MSITVYYKRFTFHNKSSRYISIDCLEAYKRELKFTYGLFQPRQLRCWFGVSYSGTSSLHQHRLHQRMGVGLSWPRTNLNRLREPFLKNRACVACSDLSTGNEMKDFHFKCQIEATVARGPVMFGYQWACRARSNIWSRGGF